MASTPLVAGQIDRRYGPARRSIMRWSFHVHRHRDDGIRDHPSPADTGKAPVSPDQNAAGITTIARIPLCIRNRVSPNAITTCGMIVWMVRIEM